MFIVKKIGKQNDLKVFGRKWTKGTTCAWGG